MNRLPLANSTIFFSMATQSVVGRIPIQPKLSSRWFVAIGLSVGAFVFIAGLYHWYGGNQSTSPDELLDQARMERRLGHFAETESLARRAFELDPQLSSAAILAGDCAIAQSAWTRAMDYFGRVTSRDSKTLISVRLRESEILHRHLHRLADAERAYRNLLALDPDNIQANEGLSQLLCLCGRKREATPLFLRLIRQNAETDMLLLFARSDMVVSNLELLKQAEQADPLDPNPPVGLAWHAFQDEKYQEAESLLRTSLQHDSVNVPARIQLGRLLLYAHRSEEFADWAKSLPVIAAEVGDIWLIKGEMAEAVDDDAAAIRCYWEAVRLCPESKTATFRLAHRLAAEGDSRHAEAFRERLGNLIALEELQNRVMFAKDRDRSELLLPLARAYESAGRLWEAYGWSQFAIKLTENSTEFMNYANRLRQIVSTEPLKLVTDSANIARSIDLSRYPLPDLMMKSATTTNASAQIDATMTFREDAKATGLAFQYFNGVQGPPSHRMFEFTGGGIGVFDFDLDDFPDLFFSQGCSWPEGSPDISGGDRLFRNRAGVAFEDHTEHAGILEHEFGQGVAIGDFDSDGFSDLYVANIGRNRLWQNQGDGTFRDITDSAGISTAGWTTSSVMVDLTGDGLPDIYDATYAADQDAFDRVCQQSDGSTTLCMPSHFHGQADRLWSNLGDGGFQEATADVLGDVPFGMGLGVAAWDADGSGRLSLFVANDTTPCFFFRPENIRDGVTRLRERGIEAGVAFNGAGKATGSMGIAVGDINDDGRMDLLITNFYAEPNTLFVSTAPGFFEDQTRRRGLEDPSLNMLGFGTQFLDVDLDGRLELFVSNGHVDDLSGFNRPWKMSPQLFRLDGHDRFVELQNDRMGSYFQEKWLGRAVARLDWNRDGRDDLAIGHLYDPVAILTNTSVAAGRQLSLRLVGVQSNRDAIGTTVQVRIGSLTMTRQLTAGDGYQCSNERRLIFGVTQSSQIDELTVRWPSGLVQHFVDVVVPARLVIREGFIPIAGDSADRS